jgi:hypothetical protein
LKFEFQTNNIVTIYLGSEKLNATNVQVAGTKNSSTNIRLKNGEFVFDAQDQSNSLARSYFNEFGIDSFDENANYNIKINYSSERAVQPYPYTVSFGDNGEAITRSIIYADDSLTVIKLPGGEPVLDVIKNLDASRYVFECPPEYSDLIRASLNSL